MGQINATSNLMLLGLGWPWVGEFAGFIIIFTYFQLKHNLGDRQHPSTGHRPFPWERVKVYFELLKVSLLFLRYDIPCGASIFRPAARGSIHHPSRHVLFSDVLSTDARHGEELHGVGRTHQGGVAVVHGARGFATSGIWATSGCLLYTSPSPRD